jgi:hypothetical protein
MSNVDQLPAPRLQLRWAPSTIKPEYNWECHYELVIPLDQYDVRAEQYDEDGEMMPEKIKEAVIPMKPPSLRGGETTPCTVYQTGERYYDAPFRDGAHAWWDSKLLGNPPIFVIAPDGMWFARPDYEAERAKEPR